jgi:hypothetical protein
VSDGFAQSWAAEVLLRPPLIAPANSYVWPMRIAGEEEALARGALNVMVLPRQGGAYLATAALGFRDPSVPTGVFACPDADEICLLAGGYAYLANTLKPEKVTLLPVKPVISVHPAIDAGLLLFVGFHHVLAWRRERVEWETRRLSWEGIRVVEVAGSWVRGFGWDLMKDVEVEFQVDLRTGETSGGGYQVDSGQKGLRGR